MNTDEHFISHRKEPAKPLRCTKHRTKKRQRNEVRYQCKDNHACAYQKVRNASFSEKH